MSNRISTASYFDTNQISSYIRMDQRDQAKAIQSMANTDRLIRTFENNHREMLKQNETHHSDNLKMLSEQNVIARHQVNESVRANRNLADIAYNMETIGDVLTDFSIKNLSLLESVDTTLTTSLKHLAMINYGVDNIIELLRVPEFEKERIFHIQEAFKYLDMSIVNPDRCIDAMEYLQKAKQLNDRDPLVNYNIALLLQHRSNTLDIVEAKKYLQRALDYVYNDNKFKSMILSELAFNAMASGDINESIRLSTEATRYNSKNIDAIYYYMDAKIISGEFGSSMNMLYETVDLSTALKALSRHMEDGGYRNDESNDLNKSMFLFVQYCITRLVRMQNNLINDGKVSRRDGIIVNDRLLSTVSPCGFGAGNPLEVHRVMEMFREEYEPLDVRKEVYR